MSRVWAREDGFTLIELMIVIVVLGILAGIAVPRLTGVQGRAQRAVLEANANTIRNVMEMYRAFEGSYPDLTTVSSIDDLNGALGDDFNISDLNLTIPENETGDSEVSGDGGDEYSITVEDDYGNYLTISDNGLTDKSWENGEE